ncbi:MAG TPA: class I SAM-dependent methyltransferase [Gaiellaceae bacterium]
MSDRAARSRSFETVAAEYERYRPDYPSAAIAWAAGQLGLGAGSRVLDVGAGTGKLTRGLVAAGFEVAAVEPGGAMLDELRRVVPEAEAHEATAEDVPLPDESCDAVFAAQSFHWFDRERALPELQRVLKPGGGLALVWNWWDERDPLQAELGPVIGYAGLVPYRESELPGPPWFELLGSTVIETLTESGPDDLVGQLSTTSQFVVAEPDERERALREVLAIASRYGERFAWPQLTYVFVYRRIDSA